MNRIVTHYRIHGMDCAEETAALRREVGPIAGGDDNLSFDLLRGRMTLTSEGPATDVDSIIDAVRRAGMRAEVWEDAAAQTTEDGLADGRAIALGVSGAFLAIGFLLHAALGGGLRAAVAGEHGVPIWAAVAYGLSALSGAWYILPRAWAALRRLRPDMNLLMTIAVTGAMFIDQWLEAAMVSFLFALSLLLESWSVGRARRAVEKLLESAPDSVRLVDDDGVEREVSPESVEAGASFVVLPGEKIPLDGLVVQGESDVNQAPITGESMPVGKHSGDEVFAGCINGNGTLVIQSTKPADRTTLANIIRLVTEAQSRRAPSEQWVEKFARV
ncbi:MAG: cation-translocating P-type ATPase, partial [Deltaproteobacteria bacterium]|nr:cation-translocating P-type ATPase [Deltaproteobacteria bacterium]